MRIGGFGHISSEEILLPVRPAYIALTLLGALMLNLLPLTGWALAVRPDFVALALLYWGIHQPRKIGFFPAWLLGLAMDVADGSLFGQHALAYSAMMFAAIFLHRRVSMFDLRHQMLHVLVILLADAADRARRAGGGGRRTARLVVFPLQRYRGAAVAGHRMFVFTDAAAAAA